MIGWVSTALAYLALAEEDPVRAPVYIRRAAAALTKRAGLPHESSHIEVFTEVTPLALATAALREIARLRSHTGPITRYERATDIAEAALAAMWAIGPEEDQPSQAFAVTSK